ncbi:MAG: DUF998 domain-containing protein [Nitrososphaerota archaeon]|nr:DUF998 domain-containing protein [Nitrososphaerota archaeon]MDG7021974.1 DUF998 domain-containing protein [Nitrososphaerota archaeon]
MRTGAGDALAAGSGRDARRAGALFLSAGLLFLLLNTAAESLYPGYSVQNNAMSDLAAVGTPTTLVEEAAILGTGLCWVMGACLLYRGPGRNLLLALNVLPGAGFLLAGLSPENVNIAVHSAGALLAFPFGAAAAIQSFRVIRTPLRYFSLGLGLLSMSATFVIFFGYRVVGPCGTCSYGAALDKLGLGLGGWEAMIIYPLLVWLMGFGGQLLGQGRVEATL